MNEGFEYKKWPDNASFLAFHHRRQSNKKSNFIKEITDIKWQDINFFVDDREYYILLPEIIREYLNKRGKEYGVWSDGDNKGIRFSLDEPFNGLNRAHFSSKRGGGLPIKLRGMGLGLKLYRALLSHVGNLITYQSSDGFAATDKALRTWSKLAEKKSFGHDTKSIVVQEDGVPLGSAIGCVMVVDNKISEVVTKDYLESFCTLIESVQIPRGKKFVIPCEIMKEVITDEQIYRLSKSYDLSIEDRIDWLGVDMDEEIIDGDLLADMRDVNDLDNPNVRIYTIYGNELLPLGTFSYNNTPYDNMVFRKSTDEFCTNDCPSENELKPLTGFFNTGVRQAYEEKTKNLKLSRTLPDFY